MVCTSCLVIAAVHEDINVSCSDQCPYVFVCMFLLLLLLLLLLLFFGCLALKQLDCICHWAVKADYAYIHERSRSSKLTFVQQIPRTGKCENCMG